MYDRCFLWCLFDWDMSSQCKTSSSSLRHKRRRCVSALALPLGTYMRICELIILLPLSLSLSFYYISAAFYYLCPAIMTAGHTLLRVFRDNTSPLFHIP